MYELTSALPAWAPYAATGTGGAALTAAIAWALTRRRRPPDPNRPKTRTSRGDLAAAAIATAVSAEGMWETFGALDMPIPLRAATFAFIELAIVQSARRARRSMAEKYSAGVDGIAMWVLTLLTAVLSAAHELATPHPNTAVVLVRLVAPPVAAWGWERNMALERRRRGLPSGINWRITLEGILVRLRLADPGERSTADVDTHRRLAAVTRAAKKARRLESAKAARWRQRRAMARVDRLYEKADEHTHLSTDPQLQQQLLSRIGGLYNTRSLVRLTARPWWTPNATTTGEPPASDEEPGRSATTVSLLARMRERRTDKRLGIRAASPTPGSAEPRTAPPLTLPSVRPLPVRPAPSGVAWLDPARTDPPRTAPHIRACGTVRIPPVRPVWPLNPVRPDAPAQLRTPRPARTADPRTATPHAEPAPAAVPARTARTSKVAAPVPDPTQPAPEGRLPKGHWIETFADEMRATYSEGRTWEPDYDDLQTRTGYGRSWCEKAVYAARDLAAQPRTDEPRMGEPARTGTDGT